MLRDDILGNRTIIVPVRLTNSPLASSVLWYHTIRDLTTLIWFLAQYNLHSESYIRITTLGILDNYSTVEMVF